MPLLNNDVKAMTVHDSGSIDAGSIRAMDILSMSSVSNANAFRDERVGGYMSNYLPLGSGNLGNNPGLIALKPKYGSSNRKSKISAANTNEETGLDDIELLNVGEPPIQDLPN